MNRRSFFITLEGIEGTGKTTQLKLLAKELEKVDIKVVQTVEPGGTKISQEIREILLDTEHTNMDPLAELLLYCASRRQLVREIILPALKEGSAVISDRFTDSTTAYQGYGRGIDINFIETLNKAVTGGLRPDLTILLDLDVMAGLKRNRGAKKVDRMEMEDIEFHRMVRDGFLSLAASEDERMRIVDSSMPIEDVHAEIMKIVRSFLGPKK